MKFLHFFYFCRSFLPSWIPIHWPDFIRIQFGSGPGFGTLIVGENKNFPTFSNLMITSWFSPSREPLKRMSLVRPDDGWFPGIGKIRQANRSITRFSAVSSFFRRFVLFRAFLFLCLLVFLVTWMTCQRAGFVFCLFSKHMSTTETRVSISFILWV